MTLHIARGLELPDDFVTKTAAIVAKRRVGKTYTGAVLAEELVAVGLPFYALDPTSAWWGLRAAANGCDPGLPVVVIGGDHGDVPLDERAGKAIADLVVDEPSFYVIDLGLIESHAGVLRFATAFLERLYRAKAKKRDPLHGFWDEADVFAPQRPGPDETKMLSAAEAIVRRGGIRGLGTTVITQRPAVLNKNVLTQVDLLIALRIIGPQDRKAVDDYLRGEADPEKRTEVLESLSGLALGEAWIYGPGEEPAIYQRVKIRERRTFNSSATPKPGEKRIEPVRLADVDLEQLRARMAETIERAAADDPATLRKRITDLERKLLAAGRAAAAVPEPVVAEESLREVDNGIAKLALVAGRMEELAEHMTLQARDFGHGVGLFRAALAEEIGGRAEVPQRGDLATRAAPPPSSARAPAARAAAYRAPAGPARNGDQPQLKAGARKILEELARHHPMRFSRAQVGTLTGFKVTGGTFGTYWRVLRRAGYVEESGGEAWATDAGMARAGVQPAAPRTTEETLAMWSARLKRGAREMLEVLVEAHPSAVTRAELAAAVEMVPTGGTFGTYLSTLRRNGLADVAGDEIKASDTLFIGARA